MSKDTEKNFNCLSANKLLSSEKELEFENYVRSLESNLDKKAFYFQKIQARLKS